LRKEITEGVTKKKLLISPEKDFTDPTPKGTGPEVYSNLTSESKKTEIGMRERSKRLCPETTGDLSRGNGDLRKRRLHVGGKGKNAR